MTEPDHKLFEKVYKGTVQFDKFMGMDLAVNAPGKVPYTMEIKKEHLPGPDACHGGVISAMMDAVLGVGSLSWAVSKGNLCNTVELKTNYLKRVRPGDILPVSHYEKNRPVQRISTEKETLTTLKHEG